LAFHPGKGERPMDWGVAVIWSGLAVLAALISVGLRLKEALGLGLAGFFAPFFGASFLADFTCEGGLSLLRRKPERPPAEEREAEVAALRERVARLEADLELLRKRRFSGVLAALVGPGQKARGEASTRPGPRCIPVKSAPRREARLIRAKATWGRRGTSCLTSTTRPGGAVGRPLPGSREKAKDLQSGKAQEVLVKGHQAVAPRQGEGRQVGVRPEPGRKPPADQVGQGLVQALGLFQKRNPRA
jgi:hypothetical protein